MAGGNPLGLGRDIAIDLGTANTLVYVRGQGVVLNEPSIVAVDMRDGKPVAVGWEAKRMLGRTPSHITSVRPLKDGVIADFEVCEKMLRYFIQQVNASRWSRPRMVICVPSGITGVEQRAVQDAAERNDGDFRRAAADVDDHVARWLVHGDTRTDGGCHGLFDDVDRLACAGVFGGVLYRALLDTGDARWNTDHHAGPAPSAGVHLLYEVAQHLFAHFEVCDDAVFQWSNRRDV